MEPSFLESSHVVAKPFRDLSEVARLLESDDDRLKESKIGTRIPRRINPTGLRLDRQEVLHPQKKQDPDSTRSQVAE